MLGVRGSRAAGIASAALFIACLLVFAMPTAVTADTERSRRFSDDDDSRDDRRDASGDDSSSDIRGTGREWRPRFPFELRLIEIADADDPFSPGNEDGRRDSNTLRLVFAAGPLTSTRARPVQRDDLLGMLNSIRTNRHVLVRADVAVRSPAGEIVRTFHRELEYVKPLDLVELPTRRGRIAPFARIATEITWDGRDANGAFVADGTYRYEITGDLYSYADPPNRHKHDVVTPPGDVVLARLEPTATDVTVDNSPPQIVVSNVPDCSSVDVIPEIAVQDVHPVSNVFAVDGQPYTPGAPVTTEGEHVLRVESEDLAGNRSAIEISFIIDRTPPVITLSGVGDGAFVSVDVSLGAEVVDEHLTSVEYVLNDFPYEPGSIISDQGDYTFTVRASDCAENRTETSLSFTIDKTPPEITISDVPECTAANVLPLIDIVEPHPDVEELTLDQAPYLRGTEIVDEADHVLSVVAIDRAGNRAEKTLSFVIDRTEPVITLSGVVQDGFVNADVLLNAAVEDLHLVEDSTLITLNGEPFALGTPLVEEGSYTLLVSAEDCAGNAASDELRFTIDKTPPEITLADVPDCTAEAVTPSIRIDEPHPGSEEITLDGAPYTAGTPVVEEADHEIVVTATDRAGNSASASATFIIDATAPLIELGGVAEGAYVNTEVLPEISIEDEHLDASETALNGNPYEPGTPILDEGLYTLSATATDCAGNTAERSLRFTIDKTPPAITIEQPADAATTREPQVTVTGRVADSSPIALVSCNETAASWDGTLFSCAVALLEGANAITVQATDAAGNVGSAGVSVTRVIDVIPPQVSLAAPAQTTPGSEFLVTAEAFDNQAVVSVTFTVDGGDPTQDDTPPYTRTIRVPDIVTLGAQIAVRAVAVDPSGNAGSDDKAITIVGEIDVQAPVVGLSVPPQAAPGSTVRVVAEAGDDVGVASVTFSANEAAIDRDEIAPYQTTYTVPADAAIGSLIVFTARAADFAGNASTARASTEVTDDADSSPPTVSLDAPQTTYPGASLVLLAAADDDVGVAAVTFYVDGLLAGTDNSAPYRATFRVPDDALVGDLLPVEAHAIDFADLESIDRAEIEIVEPPPAGSAILAGAVYDDTTGLPIEGALVRLISVAGERVGPAATSQDVATDAIAVDARRGAERLRRREASEGRAAPNWEFLTDARGRYRIGVDDGEVELSISAPGYTEATRVVRAVAGRRVDPLDA
ncbi:MAG: hypothetical protein JSV80_01140, partial [Acidobacteriota bacterium]